MAEKETEFKLLFGQADYDRLQALLAEPVRTRNFVNRYYTVEGGTDRRDWVLRLRVEGERKELTLKIGREVGPGLYDSVEYSELVQAEEPSDWQDCEPIKVLRQEVSQAPLVLQGEARNERRLFTPPIPVGDFWELDRCVLPGGRTFCELEVEVEAGSAEECANLGRSLNEWLSAKGVTAEPSKMTKYARFLASLHQGRGYS